LNPFDSAPIIEIAVESIDIGPRLRRQDRNTGDAYVPRPSFRGSIQDRGLINPITVRRSPIAGRYDLITGLGRLKAFQLLGRKQIPARIWDVDDEMKVALERDENIERVPLSALDAGEKRYGECVQETKTDRLLKQKYSDESKKKPGPKKKDGEPSDREVAQATGMKRSTVQADRQYVEACERYPFLKQLAATPAVQIAKMLDLLEEEARPALVELVSSLEKTQIKKAAATLATKLAADQARIAQLWGSRDDGERELARAVALDAPALHDQCNEFIQAALGTFQKAVFELAEALKASPPQMVERMRGELATTRGVVAKECEKWRVIARASSDCQQDRMRAFATAN
jgi:ParB-like chromosome segregation protein Spo0J